MRHVSLLRDGTLSKYLNEIHKFPLLSQDEEYVLAKDWADNKSKKSIDKLVKGHLRLVVQIANGYSGYGIPIQELISEGHIGMLQAIEHYKPDLGFRLSTYSSWWIRARIQEYIYNSKYIVRLGTSKAYKKLFFCLNKMKRILGVDKVGDEAAEKISNELNIPKDKVIDADNRLSSVDFSINAPVGSGNDSASWEDFLVDANATSEEAILEKQECEYRRKMFDYALSKLSDRERNIVLWHRLTEPPETLAQIGEKLGVSKERVRQLDDRAMLKIKTWISEYVKSTKNSKSNAL